MLIAHCSGFAIANLNELASATQLQSLHRRKGHTVSREYGTLAEWSKALTVSEQVQWRQIGQKKGGQLLFQENKIDPDFIFD